MILHLRRPVFASKWKTCSLFLLLYPDPHFLPQLRSLIFLPGIQTATCKGHVYLLLLEIMPGRSMESEPAGKVRTRGAPLCILIAKWMIWGLIPHEMLLSREETKISCDLRQI